MRHNRFKRSAILRSGMVWMLCCLYLLFSVGIVKATHFCMGREASVSYFTAEAEKCPCSLFAAGKDNCCSDEHGLLKLEDSQKTLSSLVVTFPAFIFLGDTFSVLAFSGASGPAAARFFRPSDRPPLPKPLFKFHCSYVFYDDSLKA